jgi:hypothetical protein
MVGIPVHFGVFPFIFILEMKKWILKKEGGQPDGPLQGLAAEQPTGQLNPRLAGALSIGEQRPGAAWAKVAALNRLSGFRATIGRGLRSPLGNHPRLGSLMSHPTLRNKAMCISYMRQEDNIYNNRVYRDKCYNNQSIYYIAEDLLQNKRINIKRSKDRRRQCQLRNATYIRSNSSLCGSSWTTCSSPVGGCETARVSSHMIIAQQVVGNNVTWTHQRWELMECKAYQREWLKLSIAFNVGQTFISNY